VNAHYQQRPGGPGRRKGTAAEHAASDYVPMLSGYDAELRRHNEVPAEPGHRPCASPRQAGGRPGGCEDSARSRAAWVVRYRCSGMLVVRAAAAR
jgi:hypothetical protein